MAKIPFQLRRRSIPGAVRQPRATADDFGGGLGDVLQDVEAKVSNYAQDYLDKKFKEESDIFVSKTQSEARAKFTRRAIELRKTMEGDISGTLDFEYQAHRSATLAGAPNQDAARRAGIALDAIGGTMRSNSIIGDEAARDKRVEFQSQQSHRDNLTTVYDNFDALYTVMKTEDAQIQNMRLNPQTKKELIVSRRKELGLQALTGLVDKNKAGAEQVLRILTSPTNTEFNILLNVPPGVPIPKGGFKLEDLLDVKQRQKLEKYATTTIESHDAEVRLKAADDARARALVQRDIKNNLFLQFEIGKLTNELIKTSGADAETKSSLRTHLILRAQGREDPGPPPADRSEAYQDLADTIDVTDPEDIEIIDEAIDWHVANRYISVGQGNSLSKRLTQPVNRARTLFEKTLKNRITGTNKVSGIEDPVGDALYEKSIFEIDDAVREAREADIPLYELFNPNTDEGKKLRSRMKKFSRSPDQILDDIAKALTGDIAGGAGGASAKKSDQTIIDSIIKLFD